MKCNKGTDLVCTYWDKCNKADICKNVPKEIRKKLVESNCEFLSNPQVPKRAKKVAR